MVAFPNDTDTLPEHVLTVSVAPIQECFTLDSQDVRYQNTFKAKTFHIRLI